MEMSEGLPVEAEEAGEETARRAIGDTPISGRFPIYCAPDIHVKDLVDALAHMGLVLTAKPDGSWFMDQVHAMALVRKDNTGT